ncbi:MAG: bifunctional DNA-formamidopyrimidine glycosylase/DNA-(apurinic or apyrimidinic site) lyase [Solirubrobacteraceae bacterium]
MPELPEVETIRRQLAPHLEGTTIESIEILDPRWSRPLPPQELEAALTGAQVQSLGRAGKYLIWELSGERCIRPDAPACMRRDAARFLLVHLRMTGAMLFDPPSEPAHARVRFVLSDSHRLVYVDPRRFGTAHLLHGREALTQYLAARLGAEPLTEAFTAVHLQSIARGRTAPIKSFLLDQRRIAGVGNIYADEALFRARIHPLRPAGRLSAAQWRRLRAAIEVALTAGIDAKGASIDDFRHVDGARGSFQDAFLVHRRAGKDCPTCGREIRKLVVGGRGTYVCEHCQPRPRARRSGR